MTRADKVTASRLYLAPAFFALFMWGETAGLPGWAVVVLLALLFAVIELSDLFDGMVARGSGTVSAFGKLFDPFADVFARITYFVCFAWVGIMPLWILLLILYREFGILFIRMVLAEKGIAMAARSGGKAKAVFYMIAGAFSLVYWGLPRFGLHLGAGDVWARWFVIGLYVIAAILAVASFVDYWLHFRKALAGTS